MGLCYAWHTEFRALVSCNMSHISRWYRQKVSIIISQLFQFEYGHWGYCLLTLLNSFAFECSYAACWVDKARFHTNGGGVSKALCQDLSKYCSKTRYSLNTPLSASIYLGDDFVHYFPLSSIIYVKACINSYCCINKGIEKCSSTHDLLALVYTVIL